MMLKKNTIAGFAGLVFLIFIIAAQPAFSQTTLDRISVADRSDGMGFVTRLHLTSAPDSFKVAHVNEHYIQVVLYGVDQVAPRIFQPERPFVIERITAFDSADGSGKSVELYLYREQFVRINAYPDVNGRDILISLFSAAREADREPFTASRPLFGADAVAVTEPVEEPPAAEPETPQQPAEEPAADTAPPAEIREEPETQERRRFSFNIRSWVMDFLTHQNHDALYRITPDDPAWEYSRLVLSDEESEQERSYLLRPEIYSPSKGYSHRFENSAQLVANRDSLFQMRVFSPMVYTSYNKEIPLGQNDGALWQGRGRNWFMRTGVGVQYGPFTMVLRPQFTYSQNREFPFENFDISIHPRYGNNEFQDYLMYADLPLRFGDESFSSFHLGDSYIQADFRRFATGISNERIWTGPAVHNPLIFSSNAPGFTHFFFRTSDPLQTRIGHIEGQYIWGTLSDSGYFDVVEYDNRRYVNALTLNYKPSFIPNFHAGFTRAGYSYLAGGFGLPDLFLFLRSSQTAEAAAQSDKSGARMHLMSVYFRWLFPAADMEVYAEWGRNDYNRTFRDFMAEPQLNRGYVLGFIKRFTMSPANKLVFNTEITNMENSSVASTKRDFNIWYESQAIGQGFTHHGQVIGAGIGPGSSTQQMHVTYFGRRIIAGISAARIAHKMDRHFKYEDYFRSFSPWPEFYYLLDRHEIEMRYGFHATVELAFGIDAGIRYIISNIDNRFNVRGVDVHNNQFSFLLRYHF